MIDRSDDRRRALEIICEKTESLIDIGGVEGDAAQQSREFSIGILSGKHDGLVTANPCRVINPMRLATTKSKVLFRTQDEVGQRLMKPIEAWKIDISAVHNNEAARFKNYAIQSVRIAGMGASNVDQYRDSTLNVEQSAQFDGPSGTFVRRPGEQRQRDIDDRRIQSIKSAVQIQAQIDIPMEGPGLLNQMLSEVGVDAPISRLIGIGKRGPPDRRSKPGMVELCFMRGKTDFDVSQTLTPCQLRECHRQELFPATQPTHTAIPIVATHVTTKVFVLDEGNDL